MKYNIKKLALPSPCISAAFSPLFPLALTLALALSLTSCSDFLDKEKGNELTENQTFNDWENLKAYHLDGYNYLRHGALKVYDGSDWAGQASWMDAATDLAMCSYSSGGVRRSFNVGNYYSPYGATELVNTWEHYYRAIRKMNTTIARIESVPKPTAENSLASYENDKKNYTAEAKFLRGYFYWELFLRYGPVPYIKDRLEPEAGAEALSQEYNTRPSVQEFIAEVMADLDETTVEANLLDNMTVDDRAGRITKGMACGLRARIMLYLASPRYAGENEFTQKFGKSGVTWQQAADAQKKFIDTYGAGKFYALESNYSDAILKTVYTGNQEVIFWRNDGARGWGDIYLDVPTAEGGRGGNCPTQNLVDMYDMQNGTSPFTSYDATGAPAYGGNYLNVSGIINSESGYNDASPITGRDPRFNATVLYNGEEWGTKTLEIFDGGADNAVGDANATKTGYYMRKYIPQQIFNTSSHNGSASRNWIFMRYAEILLNYCEALNEVSYDQNKMVIASYLDQIRRRAGITGYVSTRLNKDLNSQEALRNFIHKERTVELAMEDHRSWDVRRWGVAEEALARPIIGMTVTKDNVYTRKQAQTRVFYTRMYNYPIPQTEVWKTEIENNPGW